MGNESSVKATQQPPQPAQTGVSIFHPICNASVRDTESHRNTILAREVQINSPKLELRLINNVTTFELVVFGFIRQIEKIISDRLLIPDVVIDLCYRFCRRLEFERNHANINVTNDGLSATLTDPRAYGTLILNGLLRTKTHDIFTLALRLECVKTNGCGLGFATPDFNESYLVGGNSGDNHSVILYGDGFFFTSEEFKSDLPECEHSTRLHWYRNWFAQGHLMMIQLNMNELVGRIWNETVRQSSENKLQFRRKSVFEIRVPTDVTIIVGLGCAYNGGPVQTVKIEHQSFDPDLWEKAFFS